MSLYRGLDLAGVFVFALSGASLAARKRFDLVGTFALAGATALGGGIARDVLLDVPPVALRDQWYLAVTAVAAGLVLIAHHVVDRFSRPVLVFDAAGMALFSVVGASRAAEHGLRWAPAVLLGVVTAVGGGITRDVLARDVPIIFRQDSELYAIPAALAAAATVATVETGTFNAATATAIAGSAFLLRALAMRHGWRAPGLRGASRDAKD